MKKQRNSEQQSPETPRRLQVNVELQDDEIDRFLAAKEKLRIRKNAPAGYALLLTGLDVVTPQAEPAAELATAQ